LAFGPLANPKKTYTLDGQRTKTADLTRFGGQFDGIRDGFNVDFLGSNGISPLES
jgi:hypothetical protein